MDGSWTLKVDGEYTDDYGHEFGEFPHTYIDELGSVCRRNARREGWLLGKEQELCPKCSGKKRKENK
jgi:hypothetical protein